MPNYPPSSFESFVGSLLQSYGLVSNVRAQRQEADQRARAATRADQLARVQMDEAGYDEVTMPTIEAPPGQNWAQRIGHLLSGGPEQPGSIVVKTHPSVRQTETAGEQAFTSARDSANYAHQDLLEGIKARNERALRAESEAGADRRNKDDNKTRLTVADMERAQRAPGLALNEKHAVIDDAIAATTGNAQQAYDQIPGDVKAKFRIGATDMNAGVARWRERKSVLTREGYQVREDIANKKGSAKEEFRSRLLAGDDPTASMNDADAWEYHVAHGATPAQATAKVNARRR